MKRFWVIFLSILLSSPVLSAQTPPPAQYDSLTLTDTIHLIPRRHLLSVLREYSFHYANHLSDAQLAPLLRTTPDSTVQPFVRRGRLAKANQIGLHAAGTSMTAAGFLIPRYLLERSGALLLSGLGFVYASVIPHGHMKR
ncbi:hypothetical protein [Spirosoma fluminis]